MVPLRYAFDEVPRDGMGAAHENGVAARQHLLDNPDALEPGAVIKLGESVPRRRVAEWNAELFRVLGAQFLVGLERLRVVALVVPEEHVATHVLCNGADSRDQVNAEGR